MSRLLALAAVLLAAPGCGAGSAPPRPVPQLDLETEEAPVVRLLDEAREAVLREPRSAAAWRHLGAALDAHRYTAEAEHCYRAALDLEPGDPRLLYHLAVVIEMQRPADEEAAELYRRVARAEPAFPPPILREGSVLQAGGRLEEAMERYFRALELDPELAVAHMRLGQTLLALDRPAEARGHLEVAVALGGAEDGPTLAALAQAHQRLGDAAVAAEISRRAQRLEASLVLLDPWRQEVSELGTSSRVCLERARARMARGDHAAAIADLLCAREGMPDQPYLHLRLATCYVETGQPELAVEPLERVLELRAELAAREAPGEPGSDRDLLGLDAMISRYRRHYEQPPPATLPALERASLAATEGDLVLALEAMQEAADAGPLPITTRLAWARVAVAHGDLELAFEKLTAVVRDDPGFADAHHLLGQVLERQGRREEARAHLRRAVGLDPDHAAAQDLSRLR